MSSVEGETDDPVVVRVREPGAHGPVDELDRAVWRSSTVLHVILDEAVEHVLVAQGPAQLERSQPGRRRLRHHRPRRRRSSGPLPSVPWPPR